MLYKKIFYSLLALEELIFSSFSYNELHNYRSSLYLRALSGTLAPTSDSSELSYRIIYDL